MIGRAAYHQPWDILGRADSAVYGAADPCSTPAQAARAMLPYIEAHLTAGGTVPLGRGSEARGRARIAGASPELCGDQRPCGAMSQAAALDRLGWCRFPYDQEVADWVASVVPDAERVVQDPDMVANWLRCGGTWFGFRRDRDAAHVDGLLPEGPKRRRHLREAHGFVLGLPLNATSAQASPMVVWEGSHLLMRAAFEAALKGVDPADWGEVDLTDIYQETRRTCFETCKRVEIHATPGEAYLVHRLALHGVAPWGAGAADAGRMIAYFRPELRCVAQWLD